VLNEISCSFKDQKTGNLKREQGNVALEKGVWKKPEMFHR
jgi:hypothetical protein